MDLEFRIPLPDDETRFLRVTGRVDRASGKPTNIIGTLQDVTEARSAVLELKRLGSRNTITGLANRESLLRSIMQTHRSPAATSDAGFQALLYLRLDRFDELTDGLGDEGGNKVLVDVGRRLCHWFGAVATGFEAKDNVAHLAREEFAVHIPSVRTGAELEQLAARVHQIFTSPMRIGKHELVVTANVGIAGSLECAKPEEMFENARTAMRIARADKNSRVAYFSAARRRNAYDIVKLEADLRLATWRGELSFNYQPLIELKTGKLTGFEALMRWQHPECGWISPAKFIPLAEQSDLAIELGAWTIESVCEQIARWDKMGLPQDFSVNVNLSGPHLAQASLPSSIAEILRDFRLTGNRIKVEITESAIADPDKAVGVLEELRSLGMQVCIDDFGTGYSSLSLLHKFPLDVLKIDKAFITPLSEPNANDAIARSILALAHSLNLTVVAEGIEDPIVARHLCELGCEIGQGYLYSKPVTATKVEDWFQQSKRPTFETGSPFRVPLDVTQTASSQSDLPLASIRSRR
ncbi:MAG: diguanylate cyclase (GGDEF)-like protein [Bradymonadia bacterium]